MTTRSTHKMLRDANKANRAVLSQADSIGRCCKHFFPIGETSGDTITDVAGDVVITDAGGFLWDATLGSAQRTTLGSTALNSGSWVDLNGKDFIAIAVSTTVDDSVVGNVHLLRIGRVGVSQKGMLIDHSNAQVRGDDDVLINGTDLDTTLTDGLTVSMAVIGDRNGNLTYRVKGDSDQSKSDSMATVVGFTPEAYFDSLGIKLQSLIIYAFEAGIPDDYEAGIDWHYTNATGTTDGTKRTAYPPWVSIT